MRPIFAARPACLTSAFLPSPQSQTSASPLPSSPSGNQFSASAPPVRGFYGYSTPPATPFFHNRHNQTRKSLLLIIINQLDGKSLLKSRISDAGSLTKNPSDKPECYILRRQRESPQELSRTSTAYRKQRTPAPRGIAGAAPRFLFKSLSGF